MQFESFLQKNGIWHEFLTKGSMHSASAASEQSGIPKDGIVKSLLFKAGDGFCLVIIQGSRRVSAKKLRRLLNEENVRLASAEEVLRVTGYAVGAVPPIGLRNIMKCVVDKNAASLDAAWAGGGSADSLVHLKIADIIKYNSPVVADVSDR